MTHDRLARCVLARDSLEFAELPKTISGKIRRVELRQRENTQPEQATTSEWRDDQFPELNQPR